MPSTNDTLVAYDFGRGDIDRLIERLGDAVIEHTTEQRPCGVDEQKRTVHLIRFDRNKMRGTEAHGAAFAAGFIPHLEH